MWTVSKRLPFASRSDSNRWPKVNVIVLQVLQVPEEKTDVDGAMYMKVLRVSKIVKGNVHSACANSGIYIYIEITRHILG